MNSALESFSQEPFPSILLSEVNAKLTCIHKALCASGPLNSLLWHTNSEGFMALATSVSAVHYDIQRRWEVPGRRHEEEKEECVEAGGRSNAAVQAIIGQILHVTLTKAGRGGGGSSSLFMDRGGRGGEGLYEAVNSWW